MSNDHQTKLKKLDFFCKRFIREMQQISPRDAENLLAIDEQICEGLFSGEEVDDFKQHFADWRKATPEITQAFKRSFAKIQEMINCSCGVHVIMILFHYMMNQNARRIIQKAKESSQTPTIQ